MLATARATWSYTNQRVQLIFDGKDRVEATINTVAVANGRYFGGGMMVAPDADLDDGQFDVIAIGDLGFSELVTSGRRLYKGTHLSMDKVTARRAKSSRRNRSTRTRWSSSTSTARRRSVAGEVRDRAGGAVDGGPGGLAMLRAVHSNRVESLLTALLEALPPADPFAPTTIVAGSHLVSRWLRREIALARGIASGLELVTFDRFVERVWPMPMRGWSRSIARSSRRCSPPCSPMMR